MLAEIKLGIRFIGISNLLKNASAFKQARSSIRGYTTTICYWTLMRIGWLDELEQKGHVATDAFCASNGFDREILSHVLHYLRRRGHIEERNGLLGFTKMGREYWQAVTTTFEIFSAYQPFFANLEKMARGEIPRRDLHRIDESVAAGFRKAGAAFTFRILEHLIAELAPSAMVELGCGNIDLSQYIGERHPQMRFLGIDNDRRFLDQAAQTIVRRGWGDRVKLLDHDLFALAGANDDFSAYSLVTAVDLFHSYYYESRERLLDLFRVLRAVFPEQQFLVSEMCLADDKAMSRIAYPMVEHELFHGLTGQRTFREGELEALLTEADFTVRKRWSMRNLAGRIFLLFD